MLNKKDIQAIQDMLNAQTLEIIGRLDAQKKELSDRLDAVKAELLADTGAASDARRQEIVEALEGQKRELSDKLDAQTQALPGALSDGVSTMIGERFGTKFDEIIDGQKTLLETLARKDKVEALEDEIVLLKQVVKSLTRDVEEIKSAQ